MSDKGQMTDSTDRRAYTRPTLEDFGTVTELTRAGTTNPGGDTFQGSVNAPGLGSGS